MKARDYFYRIGQSDADSGFRSRTRFGESMNFIWTKQQINWYRKGYYGNLKLKEIQRKEKVPCAS